MSAYLKMVLKIRIDGKELSDINNNINYFSRLFWN